MKIEEIPEEMQSAIANEIMRNKPYLVELEEHVSALKFGSLDIRLDIRGGTVEKVSFFETKTWLKPKSMEVIDTEKKA